MTKTVTATQARKTFFTLLKQAKVPGHFVNITTEGLPSVTMMSTEELEGWIETMEILSDAKLTKDLLRAKKQMKNGTMKTIPWEKVKKDVRW